MAGIQLHEIPEPAHGAWVSLRDELRAILNDDLAAMWAHGGATSIGDSDHRGDLDTHVLLSRPPTDVTAQRLEKTEDAIARRHGMELDTWYVHANDARRTDPPRHAWREGRRDTSWALHRAHWLAGRYVCLYGPEPAAIVKPPAWEDLEAELSRELEHIERHVYEGDTDAYEATYAILNSSRILHSVETHTVAISKREAGSWALEHLAARWQPALLAALRSHDGRPTADDVRLLAVEMAPFVAFARQRLPHAEDHPADAPPRWSGY